MIDANFGAIYTMFGGTVLGLDLCKHQRSLGVVGLSLAAGFVPSCPALSSVWSAWFPSRPVVGPFLALSAIPRGFPTVSISIIQCCCGGDH